MALPDFLVIGAMKCGTSTLQAQLACQPGIFMSTPKEPNFFSDDEIYAKGVAWYEGLFDKALSGDIMGEASTHYTKLPTYPNTLPRLRQALEAPKFIYLIRNPIARAISHFTHEWTMGRMPNDIETALQRYPELVDYGRYSYQIKPYLDAFGREAIFLSTLEEMNRAPQALLNRVGDFLNIRGSLIWREDLTQVNNSAERFRRFPFHEFLIENPFATALRRRIVPKRYRDQIRHSRQLKIRPEFSPESLRDLEKIFARDHSALVAMFPDCPEIETAYLFLDR